MKRYFKSSTYTSTYAILSFFNREIIKEPSASINPVIKLGSNSGKAKKFFFLEKIFKDCEIERTLLKKKISYNFTI